MGISIRNPRVEKFAREIGAESDISMTDAILGGLEEKKAAMKVGSPDPQIRTALEKLAAECSALPFDSGARQLAYEAWRRYGKGRHPASLNTGDCCAYASARQLRQPLLFTGNDFSRTDIPPVL